MTRRWCSREDKNYWRLFEAAKALARAQPNGRLPQHYCSNLSGVAYKPGAVRTMLYEIRLGRLGPEAAAEALAIQGRPGPRGVDGALIERLFFAGRNAEEILPELNTDRARRDLAPTTIFVVRSTISRIKARQRAAQPSELGVGA